LTSRLEPRLRAKPPRLADRFEAYAITLLEEAVQLPATIRQGYG